MTRGEGVIFIGVTDFILKNTLHVRENLSFFSQKLISAFAKPIELYKVLIKFGADGLKVQLPSEKPSNHGCALKISGDGIV